MADRETAERHVGLSRTKLAGLIADRLAIDTETVDDILVAFTEEVEYQLLSQKKITLKGFGVFTLRLMPPRTHHKPDTGEPIEVGPRPKAAFNFAKPLRERIIATFVPDGD